MKLTIDEIKRRDAWIVRATGYSGDVEACNVEEIYAGGDEELAKRTYLEALALSHAELHAPDSEGEYATLLDPVFERSDYALGSPFHWASGGWSRDSTSGNCYDAKIDGAQMAYVDQHGAEHSVSVQLSADEQAQLAALAENFSVDAMMAMFERLELRAATPGPARSKRAVAL
jgi:hypothetical protein